MSETTNNHIENSNRPSLAYLAGVIHGDGWCTQIALGLKVKDKDFAEAFALAVRVNFSRKVYPSRSGDHWRVSCDNARGVFDPVKNFEPKTGEDQADWLRGLFDSEGNAQLSKLKNRPPNVCRRVAMYSTTKSTLARAAQMLEYFKIKSITNPVRNSIGHKGTLTVYELRVRASLENYTAFTVIIGSSIKRKADALRSICGSYLSPADHLKIKQIAQAKGVATRLRNTARRNAL